MCWLESNRLFLLLTSYIYLAASLHVTHITYTLRKLKCKTFFMFIYSFFHVVGWLGSKMFGSLSLILASPISQLSFFFCWILFFFRFCFLLFTFTVSVKGRKNTYTFSILPIHRHENIKYFCTMDIWMQSLVVCWVEILPLPWFKLYVLLLYVFFDIYTCCTSAE